MRDNYSVKRRADLLWYITPPRFNMWMYTGPFARWRDAYDHALTQAILDCLRPGAISEEGFHVDN
jgi:hypothetical protein